MSTERVRSWERAGRRMRWTRDAGNGVHLVVCRSGRLWVASATVDRKGPRGSVYGTMEVSAPTRAAAQLLADRFASANGGDAWRFLDTPKAPT